MDDESLLGALRAHGPERDAAIAELREFLIRGLSRSLAHRYGQSLSVEDVVQDALIKILSSLDSFEGRSKFTTWAMTVANRIGISSLRRKHHRDQSLQAFTGEDGYSIEIAMSREENPEKRDDRREMMGVLQRLIDDDLTDRQRLVLRAFLDGYSTDGISEQTGTNRNAVYKMLHDARVKLKQGFEREGLSADDVMLAIE